MSVLFVAEIAIMASAVGVTVPAATFNENCQILWTPSYFMAYWYVGTDELLEGPALKLHRVSSLVFETLLFALTLVAFVKRIKEVYKKQSIIFVFFRDGTWAFALIFGMPLFPPHVTWD